VLPAATRFTSLTSSPFLCCVKPSTTHLH
jgi:hypothetical protein